MEILYQKKGIKQNLVFLFISDVYIQLRKQIYKRCKNLNLK